MTSKHGHRTLWSHEIKLEATPISASEARAFVTQCLIEHRLLYLVDSVRLVASELATNALVHAQTAFTVTLSQPDGVVLLAVRDSSEALPVPGAARVMDTHGRGLEIVNLISHGWGMDPDEGGHKAVWASFALRQRREV